MFSQLTRQQRVQFMLIISVAMLYFCSASMMLYFPKFILYLGGDEQQAGWYLGVSLLAMLVVSPFVGAMSDKWGSKPLVISGLLTYSVATYAHCFLDSLGFGMWFWRFVQGLGHALVFAPLLAAVARIIPACYRAAGIGYFTVCIQLGNTVGSFIGEFSFTEWSYQTLFIISTIVGLLAMVVMTFVCEVEINVEANEKFNSNGDIKTASKPAQFMGYMGIVLLLGSCFGVALQFMPIYFDFMLREHWIEEPITNVCFMTSTLLTVAAVRLLMGSLTDGIYRDRILMVCHAVLVLVLLGMTGIRSESSSLLVSIIFGLSYGLLYPAVNAKIMEMAPAGEHGKISGLLTMVYELGFRGVPMILGAVILHISYTVMFYLLALGYFLAVCFLLYTKLQDRKWATRLAFVSD